jgi:hypothetical protein
MGFATAHGRILRKRLLRIWHSGAARPAPTLRSEYPVWTANPQPFRGWSERATKNPQAMFCVMQPR